jgi:hypothetical protein
MRTAPAHSEQQHACLHFSSVFSLIFAVRLAMIDGFLLPALPSASR